MDKDNRTPAPEGAAEADGVAAGASRTQNTVYTLSHDWALIGRFLAPALERARRLGGEGAPAVVVLTSDAQGAVAVARAARAILGEDGPAFVPVTAAGRATRLIRGREPIGVAGPPMLLAELVRNAVLKLETVQTVILAWADDLVAVGGQPALEAVLGELPRECARVLVTGEMTPELEGLIERFMRRPRHMTDSATEEAEEPLRAPVHYVTTSDRGRPETLRRILDELDPTSVAIIAHSEEGTAEARTVLASLGYGADEAGAIVTTGTPPAGTALVLLYELPANARALHDLQEGTPERLVALVQPRQIAALRRLAGDAVAAYTFGDARRDARAREEALRDEIRGLLVEGAPTRELIALEPLLADHDGVEVAAALLRLLDDARRQRPVAGQATLPAPDDAQLPPWTRVFVNAGTRDGVSAGDLLGAMAGEAGVGREKIGRIELRDTHSLVDVSTDVVEEIVSAVTGASLRGRRLVARVDEGRDTPRRSAPREERPGRGERGERGAHRDRPHRDEGGRRGGERPFRGGPRAERGGDRPGGGRGGERGGERGGDRGPRGGRGFRSTGDERRASYGRTLRDEQQEWAERGERVRNSRRSRDDE